MKSKFMRGCAAAAAATAVVLSNVSLAAAENMPEPPHDRLPCDPNGPCDGWWRSDDKLTYCTPTNSCVNYDKTFHFVCYSGDDPFEAPFCNNTMMPLVRMELPAFIPVIPWHSFMGR